ncbi:MAG: hypothetical protein ACYDAO_02795 [Thermoplasmataceae archaeon]
MAEIESNTTDMRMQEVLKIIQEDMKKITPEQQTLLVKARTRRDQWLSAYPELKTVKPKGISSEDIIPKLITYGIFRFDGMVDGLIQEIFDAQADEIDVLMGKQMSPEGKISLLYTRLTSHILNSEKGAIVAVLSKGSLKEDQTWKKGTPEESKHHKQFGLTLWIEDKKTIRNFLIADDMVDQFIGVEQGKGYKVQLQESAKTGRIFLNKNALPKLIPEYRVDQMIMIRAIIEKGEYPPMEEPFERMANNRKEYRLVAHATANPDRSGWELNLDPPSNSSILMFSTAGTRVLEGDKILVVGQINKSLKPIPKDAPSNTPREYIPDSYTVNPSFILTIKHSTATEVPESKPEDKGSQLPPDSAKKVDEALGGL